ncbi:MAG: Na+/H+ antiporter NhaA [Actinomycetota bacterium]
MGDAGHDIRLSWSRSDRLVPRVIVRPLQEFLQTSTSSALLLFAAVVLALVWANSPWKDTYERVWTTPATLRLGSYAIAEDVRFWVNDGLMTIFFLLVGIEIKRELTTGELQRPRAAVLPVVAALGGMVVPALLYLAVVRGGEGSHGWGVPMSTDIALALGALALAARHAPPSLKPLLLTLAIVDDIGAILVIAIVYSHGGNPEALAVAVLLVLAIVVLQRQHVRAIVPYVVVGAALWLATYEAGVHPTIAGVVLGLLTPAEPFQRPAAVSAEAKRTADETVDDPHPPDADAPAWLHLAWISKEAVSPLARVEHTLLPWSSWVIVPLFALANAGVALHATVLRDASTSAVAVGIVVGLVLGKPLGIVTASLVAVRARAASLPSDTSWGDVLGLGVTAGIGFTVALFIAELAFEDTPALLDEAKVAILFASLVAGIVGWVVLRIAPDPATTLADATAGRRPG